MEQSEEAPAQLSRNQSISAHSAEMKHKHPSLFQTDDDLVLHREALSSSELEPRTSQPSEADSSEIIPCAFRSEASSE